MKIINVPIESLEDRYSAAWNRNIPKQLAAFADDVVTVYPDMPLSDTVVCGQFLNVVETNAFKAAQLCELVALIRSGQVDNSTVFFFHDVWFPGLEMLFYIRDGLGLQFKIAGMIHAGSYDPHDFLHHRGMARWATDLERSWVSELDAVFTATHFHRQMLMSNLSVFGDNIHVTGFPLYVPDDYCDEDKQNIVVFPHRLAYEKRPDLFDRMALELKTQFPTWLFVKSKDVTATKQEYYSLLRRSRVAVACSLQETWGIAQQEALFLGCQPVVPDSLSYRELYPEVFRYAKSQNDFSDADYAALKEAVSSAILFPQPPSVLREAANRLKADNAAALANITTVLRDLP